jgi:hypothetical protein
LQLDIFLTVLLIIRHNLHCLQTKQATNNKNKQQQHDLQPTIYKNLLQGESTSKNNKIMWARNASYYAERAQDDADFGAAPCDGGYRFPADKRGHATFRVATKAVGPRAGDAKFHESLEEAIAGLCKGSDERREEEEDCPMVEAAHQTTTGVTGTNGGRGQGHDGRS